MKVHKDIPGVEYWYDPSPNVRCWWAMQVDPDGNQVGEARDAYTRREIREIARGLSEDARRVQEIPGLGREIEV